MQTATRCYIGSFLRQVSKISMLNFKTPSSPTTALRLLVFVQRGAPKDPKEIMRVLMREGHLGGNLRNSYMNPSNVALSPKGADSTVIRGTTRGFSCGNRNSNFHMEHEHGVSV